MDELLADNPFLLDGEAKGYWRIDREKKWIYYIGVRGGDHREKITDPEELVRAAFVVELIEKYQYPVGHIALEVETPQRVPNFYADIIVYDEKNAKPFIVIECKKEGITDNEFEQAVLQGFGHANQHGSMYFGAVAGSTRRFAERKQFDKENPIEHALADLPIKYGKPEEWKYKKGDVKWDVQSVAQEMLSSILAKCHQTIWAGGKRNPAEAFGEVAKVIFVKVWDEKHETKKGEYYRFQRKSNEHASNVQKRINELYDKAKTKDPEVFNEDIRLSASEVTSVVEHLQGVSLSKTDLDVKGQAFQQFLGGFFKGDFGQYFTPPPTVKFCTDFFGAELDNTMKVLDPACGSGGFLLGALDFMRTQADEQFEIASGDTHEIQQHREYWHGFAERNLYGIEISEAIARVAKMNMILHDDGHTNVISNDALEDVEKMQLKNPNFKKDSFDFIFTNPPFGATIKGSEKTYLDRYELAQNGRRTRDNQKSEILFIERCHQFLKSGTGKMAIVLPDGILTNSSLQYVRDWILDHFQLLAVVSLPQDAFRYYGAGVKSSILFLRKLKVGEDVGDYPIFMAQPKRIGIDATGRKCPNDLDEVVKQWRAFQKKPQSFFLSEFTQATKVNRSQVELEKRFDAVFFSGPYASVQSSAKFPLVELRDVITYAKTGFAAGADDRVEDGQIIQIRPTNISREGELIFDKNVYIPAEAIHADDYLQRGEVLFNNTNSQELVGKTAYFDQRGEFVCSNHVTRLSAQTDRLHPRYLQIILNVYWARGVFFSLCTNWNNQSGVNPELLKTIKIPLPPLDVQKDIVARMDAAMAEKKEKEAKADALLVSIDAYLLGELRIELPDEEDEKMCFGVNREDLMSGAHRFDLPSLSPETRRIKATMKGSRFATKKLNDLCAESVAGVWGDDPQSIADDQQIIPVLRNTNFNNDFNLDIDDIAERAIETKKLSKVFLQEGDLLIEKSGGSEDQPVGRVALITTDLAGRFGFSNFLQKIVVKKDEVDSEYLFAVLKSYHAAGYTRHVQNQTTGIRNLIMEEYLDLPIPTPSGDIQKNIAAEVRARREQARALRAEAADILERAKREMESKLLKT